MAEVRAWHTVSPGVPPEYRVYHVCTGCGVGNRIESHNRRGGTGGLRMCSRCELLKKVGAC